MGPFEVEAVLLLLFVNLFFFGGNPIFMVSKPNISPNDQHESRKSVIPGPGRGGLNILGLGLRVDSGRSEVSRSFGVGRRSKELEEVEVGAGVEEDDLSEKSDEDRISAVVIGCFPDFVESASRLDFRRTVGAGDWLVSALWCGVYSVSEFFLFRFL